MYETVPEFRSGADEVRVINVASVFFSVELPNDPTGFQLAQKVLDHQHRILQPQLLDDFVITETDDQRVPRLETFVATVTSSLAIGDFGTALTNANYMSAFSESGDPDSINESQSFILTLNSHLELAKKVVEKFSEEDELLQFHGEQAFETALLYYENGDYNEAMAILKDIIHNAALYGIIGETAKSKFDPYAILTMIAK